MDDSPDDSEYFVMLKMQRELFDAVRAIQMSQIALIVVVVVLIVEDMIL